MDEVDDDVELDAVDEDEPDEEEADDDVDEPLELVEELDEVSPVSLDGSTVVSSRQPAMSITIEAIGTKRR